MNQGLELKDFIEKNKIKVQDAADVIGWERPNFYKLYDRENIDLELRTKLEAVYGTIFSVNIKGVILKESLKDIEIKDLKRLNFTQEEKIRILEEKLAVYKKWFEGKNTGE